MKAMRYLILILLAFYSQTVRAQSSYIPVNRDYIQKKTTDSSSTFFYPVLLQRFMQYDSTLNIEDYRFLYYGFPFQKNYSPYADFRNGELNELLKKKRNEEALRIANEVYEKSPVSPRTLYNRLIVMQIMGSHDSMMRLVQRQYVNMIDAIVSSGDGITCGSAFKTIFVPDQYEVMANYLNISHQGRILEGSCDKFSVKPNQLFDKDKLYFDTSETLLGLSKFFSEDKEQGKSKKKKKNS